MFKVGGKQNIKKTLSILYLSLQQQLHCELDI